MVLGQQVNPWPMLEKFGKWWASWIGSLQRLLRDPKFQEVLLWSLPALVVGMVLRVLLTYSLPYGYVQYDTPDFLVTTQRFLSNWDLVLHNKKTFLTPILFTLAFLVKFVPALVLIALIQHLFGLVMTLLSGWLVRLWFRKWKWFIIPVTLLTTANPSILWYEHALLAEFQYFFCVLLLACIASAFILFRTTRLFVWMLVTLFFTAGSRPEGKLYFAVAFLLVGLGFWGDWKQWAKKLAILSLVAVGTFAITKTGQAGILLYATVLPLAPDVPKSEPAFGPLINPLRDQYRQDDVTVRTELTTAEKTISEIAQKYLHDKNIKGDVTAAFCQKLAVEACKNKPLTLPVIAWNKFLMSMNRPSSAEFNDYWVFDKQLYAMTRKPWMYDLTQRMTGQPLRTKEEVKNWLAIHGRVPNWFGPLQDAWDNLTTEHGLPDHQYPHEKIRGLPYFFLLALAGMIAAMLRGGPLRVFHISWVIAFVGVWFVVMLTGVVNSRYRFVFEPICAIYALLLIDIVWDALSRLFAKTPAQIPQQEAVVKP